MPQSALWMVLIPIGITLLCIGVGYLAFKRTEAKVPRIVIATSLTLLVLTSIVATSIGALYVVASDLEKALELVEEARAAAAAKNFAHAELLYVEALTIADGFFGRRTKVYKGVITDLAYFRYDQGQYEKAEPLLVELLVLNREHTPGDRPSKVGVFHRLGVISRERGELAEAERYFMDALVLTEENWEGRDKHRMYLVNSLAMLHESKGRDGEAEAYYLEALDLIRSVRGESDVRVAFTMDHLGDIRGRQGRHPEASAHFKEALEILDAGGYNDRARYSGIANKLGLALFEQEDYAGAVEAFERAVTSAEIALEPDDPLYATALRNLAMAQNERSASAR